MAYSAAVLQDTPLAYWPLDDAPKAPLRMRSIGTLTADMVVKGDASLVSCGPISSHADIQGAVDLRNTQYANYGYSGGYLEADLGPQPAPTALSVECWFNFYDFRAMGYERGLVTSSDGEWSLNNMGDRFRSLLRTTGGADGWTGSNDYVFPAGKNALRAWHHVVMTWDGASQRVYINGALVKTSTVTGAAKPFRYIQLGRYSNQWSDVQLAHVAIYARALPADRITAHYTAHREPSALSEVRVAPAEVRGLSARQGKHAPLAGARMTEGGVYSHGRVIPLGSPRTNLYDMSSGFALKVMRETARLRSVIQGRQSTVLGVLPPLPISPVKTRVWPVLELTPAALANLRAGYAQGYAAALRTTIRRHTPIFIHNRSR